MSLLEYSGQMAQWPHYKESPASTQLLWRWQTVYLSPVPAPSYQSQSTMPCTQWTYLGFNWRFRVSSVFDPGWSRPPDLEVGPLHQCHLLTQTSTFLPHLVIDSFSLSTDQEQRPSVLITPHAVWAYLVLFWLWRQSPWASLRPHLLHFLLRIGYHHVVCVISRMAGAAFHARLKKSYLPWLDSSFFKIMWPHQDLPFWRINYPLYLYS